MTSLAVQRLALEPVRGPELELELLRQAQWMLMAILTLM